MNITFSIRSYNEREVCISIFEKHKSIECWFKVYIKVNDTIRTYSNRKTSFQSNRSVTLKRDMSELIIPDYLTNMKNMEGYIVCNNF